MKVNDLRIGNLVEHLGYLAKIIQIGEEETIIRSLDERYRFEYLENTDDIQPIPITPEWLIRLGFENLKERGFYKKESFFILFYGGEATFYVTSNNQSNIKKELFCESLYVHNVQNAYWFNVGYKTGEELTLKNE